MATSEPLEGMAAMLLLAGWWKPLRRPLQGLSVRSRTVGAGALGHRPHLHMKSGRPPHKLDARASFKTLKKEY